MFPTDVSRSGYSNMNIRVLIRADSSLGGILEMVFIDVDLSSLKYLTHPFVAGRIDALKRIYIEDYTRETKMRCSRLIYRFMNEDPLHRSGYYYSTLQHESQE